MKNKPKIYPESVKLAIVREVLSGQLSKHAAKQKYQIGGKSLILSWIRTFERYGVCSLKLLNDPDKNAIELKMKEDQLSDNELFKQKKALEAKIAELENQLSDERLLKHMYNRMIDIAEERYKISIRKKSNTK